MLNLKMGALRQKAKPQTSKSKGKRQLLVHNNGSAPSSTLSQAHGPPPLIYLSFFYHFKWSLAHSIIHHYCPLLLHETPHFIFLNRAIVTKAAFRINNYTLTSFKWILKSDVIATLKQWSNSCNAAN